MDGGPLNPKENFCEKKILSTVETVYPTNADNKVFTSNVVAPVYGAITTFVSQWQLIPFTLN